MTAATDHAVTALQERFGREVASRLPRHVGRLGWDARRLATHQRERLRALLAASSPGDRGARPG
jgi:hypothetical protein